MKQITQIIKKSKTLGFKVVIACMLLPKTSFADVTNTIDGAVLYLQGGLARSVGVIAIVAAGYICIFKQMFPKIYFVMILVGLGLIFGGAEIYDNYLTQS